MNNPSRRDLCVALAALASVGTASAETQPTSAPETGPRLLHSELFPFDKLIAKPSANGGASRAVVHGTLATGEFVEVHETTLPPGQMPHPPHRHTHSEFLLIREGKLQVDSDGQRGVIEAGGVIFTASGVLHGLKNIGDVPANYFVVAVGLQKALP
ncbi:cupin domain-containing protein [Granulicella tundricola]|uniref:Cupin 2 conserved barrel domain protein n=1 Tax=Granulicella tundricola (strain ATCC BAA-1859 / DSM 23138 / MP5ACTX9) TaxID=1198114 RepID=E8X5T9_GRATM|nr:cupin domain-containing protein [Granulicella tundricola]ADW70823.1 Cupin 2 conserved barrel domain protein [Granulicella tundricola MP5ACTX9]